jgi:Spy/CpxP family protein refolding chaperone
MKHNSRVMTLLALLAVLAFPAATVPVAAQNPDQPATAPEPQQGGDLIRQLNLTPEQREQIRSIRQGNQTERATINQRLRESNQALDEALDSDTPDEALIEQRVRDVSAAQAAAMRIRISTEIKVRRVLTAEQRTVLRSLQHQALELQRERRLANPNAQRKREERTLQNRNGLGPLLRPRDNPRRPRQ